MKAMSAAANVAYVLPLGSRPRLTRSCSFADLKLLGPRWSRRSQPQVEETSGRQQIGNDHIFRHRTRQSGNAATEPHRVYLATTKRDGSISGLPDISYARLLPPRAVTWRALNWWPLVAAKMRAGCGLAREERLEGLSLERQEQGRCGQALLGASLLILLVPRFRSSSCIAAPSCTNFGNKGH
jgi:hypothetical protein